MSLIKLGTIKRIIPDDKIYTNIDTEWECEYMSILGNYNVTLKFNSLSYSFNTVRKPEKITRIDHNKWLFQESNKFYFAMTNPDKIILTKHFISFSFTEKGLYYMKNVCGTLNFLNFQTLKIKIYIRGDYFTFFQGYILKHDSFQTCVYINPDILPENINMDIFNLLSDSLLIDSEVKKSSKSITVHFKDQTSNLTEDVLRSFKSEFINEQLKDEQDVYLDISYSDFEIDNLSTLKYLKSGCMEILYADLLMKDFISKII